MIKKEGCENRQSTLNWAIIYKTFTVIIQKLTFGDNLFTYFTFILKSGVTLMINNTVDYKILHKMVAAGLYS